MSQIIEFNDTFTNKSKLPNVYLSSYLNFDTFPCVFNLLVYLRGQKVSCEGSDRDSVSPAGNLPRSSSLPP